MPEETDAILSDITNEKDAPKLLQGRASGQVTPAVSDDEGGLDESTIHVNQGGRLHQTRHIHHRTW